ncbi:hypothetical protein, partial [Mesorhizobium sp. M1C.F.Ca.ET.195.01.1.1]|uniref:hypothetical protein n=1 Tax=Mesorhizobium sp. M1C.F.Ca.ET.195.01.1.1 TaxID=2563927 RepID=UPI001AED711A
LFLAAMREPERLNPIHETGTDEWDFRSTGKQIFRKTENVLPVQPPRLVGKQLGESGQKA